MQPDHLVVDRPPQTSGKSTVGDRIARGEASEVESAFDTSDAKAAIADNSAISYPSLFALEDSGGRDGDRDGPALPRAALLTKEEEQMLGRTIRESRLEMTATLGQIPAALGVFVDLMMQADAGERPTTDAFFAPFETFQAVSQNADEQQDPEGTATSEHMNWRQAAHAAQSLYRDWRALVRRTPDGDETRAMRKRLTTTARRIRPGFFALGEASRICSELDRRVSAVETELNAYHADILPAILPAPRTNALCDKHLRPVPTRAPSTWHDRGQTLLQIQSESGVDLTTLRDCCRKASAAHARWVRSRDRMVGANIGLAYSMAHRLRGNGVAFDDLVQEALLGLMRAVEKFDYRMGYKFSTYAVQWIRQSTTRAIADASRTIRVAAHVHDDIVRLRKLARRLEQRVGREATVQELSQAAGVPGWKVERAFRLARQPLSLDASPGEVDDSPLSSVIEDATVEDPRTSAHDAKLAGKFAAILDDLPPREALIVRLRHGIDGTEVHTLEEIGCILGITRERTRQLEARAFKRLRLRVSQDFLQGLEP